jgi:hypothetical protein
VSGLIFNQDCDAFYMSRAGERLDAETAASWVDQYAGTQVREIFLNVNARRASFPSKVWETYWDGYLPHAAEGEPWFAGRPKEWFERLGRDWERQLRAMIHTAWQLHHDGLDLYAVWIERCRQRNLSPWLSVRMNDVHYTLDPDHIFHTEFWRTRPELRRVPYRSKWWEDHAFDYGQAEVREYFLKLIRELAERYDFDGIELDWLRHQLNFRPGREREDAPLLTAFVAEVRRVLNEWEQRREHEIRLAARVPSQPTACTALGFDAAQWARQGLLDVLVVCGTFGTIESTMPIELWRELLDGTGVALAAGLECSLMPYPSFPRYPANSLETVRGAALSLLDRGVDRIYLFNYFDSDKHAATKSASKQKSPSPLSSPPEGRGNVCERAAENDSSPRGGGGRVRGDAWDRHLLRDDYDALLREVGEPSTLIGKSRRHVLTYTNVAAPGEAITARLPARVGAGSWESFRLHIGPPPSSGPAYVVLGVLDGAPDAASSFEVRINGTLCHAKGSVSLPEPKPDCPTHQFQIPLTALHRGFNLIDVMSPRDAILGWVEISACPSVELP